MVETTRQGLGEIAGGVRVGTCPGDPVRDERFVGAGPEVAVLGGDAADVSGQRLVAGPAQGDGLLQRGVGYTVGHGWPPAVNRLNAPVAVAYAATRIDASL